MGGRSVFISCGQFTEAEKKLGLRIAQMVRDSTDMKPFFAEQVQDLNSLDENVLNALHSCNAFILVLHPRGTIDRPDGSHLVRASVWIEQEIAIAAYIQRIEKRELPIIAFKHSSVGREGIRELLHLNPTPFTDDAEVLVALPKLLQPWTNLRPSEVLVEFLSEGKEMQDGHIIRKLSLKLQNNTNQQLTGYEAEIRIPSGLLKHWRASYPNEKPSGDPTVRCFRIRSIQDGRPVPGPHEQASIWGDKYCLECASNDLLRIKPVSMDEKVTATLWADGRDYKTEKSARELAGN